jgi:hypothetical protein
MGEPPSSILNVSVCRCQLLTPTSNGRLEIVEIVEDPRRFASGLISYAPQAAARTAT